MLINKEIIFFFNDQFHQRNDNNTWEKHDLENYQFNSKFEEVDIYLDSPYFNIIPDELFDEIADEQKKQFLVSNKSNYDFFSQTIPNLDGQLFWCEKQIIINSIKDKIPNCNFNPIIKPFLINNKDSELKFYLAEKFIYISSFSNGQLMLANRFFINNIDDVLYFILNTIKETRLINLNFKISAYGLKDDEITKKLKSIFPNNKYITHQSSDLNSIFK